MSETTAVDPKVTSPWTVAKEIAEREVKQATYALEDAVRKMAEDDAEAFKTREYNKLRVRRLERDVEAANLLLTAAQAGLDAHG